MWSNQLNKKNNLIFEVDTSLFVFLQTVNNKLIIVNEQMKNQQMKTLA